MVMLEGLYFSHSEKVLASYEARKICSTVSLMVSKHGCKY